MKLVTRAQLGWPSANSREIPTAPCRNGLVLHYDSNNTDLAGKSHSACINYWNNARHFHINTRGWLDIGYSYMACPHGYVLEGRGFGRQQAAQEGYNSTWTSCTLASGPNDVLVQKQIDTVNDLFYWLVHTHDVKAIVKGHRDFNSTDCPGNRIYSGITHSRFRPIKFAEDDLPYSAKELEDIVAKGVQQALYSDSYPAPGNVIGDEFDPDKNPGFWKSNKNWKFVSLAFQAVQGAITNYRLLKQLQADVTEIKKKIQ